MNGAAFQGFNKIKYISLELNECISEKLNGSSGIKAFQQKVTKKCAFDEAKPGTNQVACEDVQSKSHTVEPTFLEVKICFMDKISSIATTGVTFPDTRDDSIQGLILSENKNIFYLPERTGTKFVSLLFYEANYCSISDISKENFDGFKNLKRLELKRNTIEKISSDTFKELTRLIILDLGKVERFFSFRKLFYDLSFQMKTKFDS
jgi:Leucine rich repeat